MEKRWHKFVRYADDISIFVGSRRAGERVLEGCIAWIEKELKLKVNREKSGVREVNKAQILGFGFYCSTGGIIEARISNKSFSRLTVIWAYHTNKLICGPTPEKATGEYHIALF